MYLVGRVQRLQVLTADDQVKLHHVGGSHTYGLSLHEAGGAAGNDVAEHEGGVAATSLASKLPQVEPDTYIPSYLNTRHMPYVLNVLPTYFTGYSHGNMKGNYKSTL